MKKDDIVLGVSAILNNYELKGLLQALIPISVKSRTKKHMVGKTIRRRNTDDETEYGEIKNLLSIVNLARIQRPFLNISTIDTSTKSYAIGFVKNIISYIRLNSSFSTPILNELSFKLSKLETLKLSIEKMIPCTIEKTIPFGGKKYAAQ